jgi:ABC-type uncharacterized transport system substrate-binding protein
MGSIVKRLAFGITLVALASAALLLSDTGRRGRVPRVALVQQTSVPPLDDGARGVVDGLAANGFRDGDTVELARFNAQGDTAAANAIAREVTSGRYDLVVTVSTLSLQSVAGANRAGRVKHVFGIVADPPSAGVGVGPNGPLDHPPHLVGQGILLPAADSFRLARRLNPGLKKVGLAWNPSEANSLKFTTMGREVCRELGIELLEANVDSSAAVLDAVQSLTARGAEAIWASGDVMISSALGTVVGAARRSGIPVFTITPGDPERGTLFDLGIDFYEAGRLEGELAARVLRGEDPAALPVEDVVARVPRRLVINRRTLDGLSGPWRIPDEVLALATVVVDADGVHEKKRGIARTPAPGRVYRVGVASFGPDPGADACLGGFREGLAGRGFVEGENLQLRTAHAQGEIAHIPAVLLSLDNEDLDLIVPMTTPVLTAACGIVRKKPLVFTYVYDPVAAGAGTSRTEHRPNVTGVGSFPPLADTVDVIRRLVPGVRAVGTLYNSSEANSRRVMEVARKEFTAKGLKLEEISVTGTSEVAQSARALADRSVQAVWITGDNTALQAFDGIMKVTADAGLPAVINDPEFTDRGAVACVGLGWRESGRAAGVLAARVLLGEDPRGLAFEEVAVKKVILNGDAARRLGIRFPPELLAEAGR